MSRRLDGINAGETVRPEFMIDLKGRPYPQWAGVLDLATRLGLVKLMTTVVQIPTAENDHLAVVMARAEFDDGAVFEDVGDCSPRSTSPQLAPASLRMASVRAKGRVLRDACNVGAETAEEASGHAEAGAGRSNMQTRTASQPRGANGPPACTWPDCGLVLSQKQNAVSRKATGHAYCEAHQLQAERALQHTLAANPAL